MNNGVKRYASEEYVDNALANIGVDSVFVVNVIRDSSTDTYTSDKTYEEICQAYQDEKSIYSVCDIGAGFEIVGTLANFINGIHFYTHQANVNGILSYDLVIKSNNEVTMTSYILNTIQITSTKTYDTLNTTDKTLIGSINEVNEKVDNALVDAGGDSTFVTTVTGDAENGYVSDKTYAEILGAYNSGKTCYIYITNNLLGGLIISTEIYELYKIENGNLKFSCIERGTSGVVYYEFVMNADGNINRYTLGFNQFNIAAINTNDTLATEDKTLVGAINELNARPAVQITTWGADD